MIKFDTQTGCEYEKCFPLKKSSYEGDGHKTFPKITDYKDSGVFAASQYKANYACLELF